MVLISLMTRACFVLRYSKGSADQMFPLNWSYVVIRTSERLWSSVTSRCVTAAWAYAQIEQRSTPCWSKNTFQLICCSLKDKHCTCRMLSFVLRLDIHIYTHTTNEHAACKSFSSKRNQKKKPMRMEEAGGALNMYLLCDYLRDDRPPFVIWP